MILTRRKCSSIVDYEKELNKRPYSVYVIGKRIKDGAEFSDSADKIMYGDNILVDIRGREYVLRKRVDGKYELIGDEKKEEVATMSLL